MNKVSVTVYGKINLSLNILGKMDGMHLIDSVMQSVSLADTVTARKRRDNRLSVAFVGENAEFIDKNYNSVKKTAEYLQNVFGAFGADLLVEKGIPLSGGLGGSSAGAVGALIALNKLFGFFGGETEIYKAAAGLGSDLSFMLKGGCARTCGTGEKIEPIDNNLPLYAVVCHADGRVNSREAYARFDTLNPSLCHSPSDNGALIKLLKEGDTAAFKHFDNALAAASQSLCGRIDCVKNALIAEGAKAAVMTGSGGCVAGFFADKARADGAAAALKKRGLWAKSCFSTNNGVNIL